MPASNLPPFKLTVGLLDFSVEAENITFSNSDPGGYEMMNFDLEVGRADHINPGDTATLQDGIGIIWQGRVAEPAKQIKHGWHSNRKVGTATTRISCEGPGAAAKDNVMSMVYIDRDLTRWQEWALRRQLGLIQGGLNVGLWTWQIGANDNASPGFIVQAPGPFTGQTPLAEIWYDAGPNNRLGPVRATLTPYSFGAGDTHAIVSFVFSSDLNATTFQGAQVGNFPSSGAGLSFPINGFSCRYFLFQLQYQFTGTAGAAGTTYGWQVNNVSVQGDHGMALQNTAAGVASDGFYTSQIAQHAALNAIGQGARFRMGRVDQFINFIVLHYVQYTPVQHDQIISDMAKLGPAHYGVWESDSLFDDTPAFTFRSYNSAANVFTSLADCNEADVSERLANLYTSATITYQDAAGTQGLITVTLPNYLLNAVGIGRTTTLDLGISSATAAKVFASFVLQILFAQARTAGSVTLPKKIRDAGGAPLAAYRLKSGIDRIRINDLPTRAGLITPFDSDSFRISRQESNIDTTSGEVTTRVELDAGPNLIETLQARLAIGSTLAGLG